MPEPQWPAALGWIELAQGRWKPGRYYLMANFEWSGPDADTLHFLNTAYDFRRLPGHGGERPGSAQIAAAAEELKATKSHVGPPNPEPDPEGAVY